MEHFGTIQICHWVFCRVTKMSLMLKVWLISNNPTSTLPQALSGEQADGLCNMLGKAPGKSLRKSTLSSPRNPAVCPSHLKYLPPTAQDASQPAHRTSQAVRSSFPLELDVFITSTYQCASLYLAAAVLLILSCPTGWPWQASFSSCGYGISLPGTLGVIVFSYGAAGA